jgi:hypothetical protein
LPEVQGNTDRKIITIDEMEPLNAQQQEFLNSRIDDTRRQLEEEKSDDRRYYEDEIERMRTEMRENYHDL